MGVYMSEDEVREVLRRQAAKRGETLPETEAPKKKSKYGNRRVEVDGMKFDSQHEADVYQELMLKKMAGAVRMPSGEL